MMSGSVHAPWISGTLLSRGKDFFSMFESERHDGVKKMECCGEEGIMSPSESRGNISIKIVSGVKRSGIPDTIKMSEAAGR